MEEKVKTKFIKYLLDNNNDPSFIITSKETQNEWDNLDENVKKESKHSLKNISHKMALELSIDSVCEVLNQLDERISKLENKED